jgi:hypothetical protein
MSQLEDYLEKRVEVYRDQLKLPMDGMPAWYQRNAKELQAILMHPDIMTDVVRLGFVEMDGLLENRGALIAAFYRTYDLSIEYAERLVDFAITKEKTVLQPLVQNAGIHFFSNEKKTAGVITSKTARILYDHIQAEYGHERPSTIYLRIGPGANKEDVKDYIDAFWDKYIQPLRDAELHTGKQVRAKPKLLRDTEIYALWKHGKRYAEIQEAINEKYDEFLTDPELRKIVERIKPKTELLAKLAEQFEDMYPLATEQNKKLALSTFDSGNDPELFRLKIV